MGCQKRRRRCSKRCGLKLARPSSLPTKAISEAELLRGAAASTGNFFVNLIQIYSRFRRRRCAPEIRGVQFSPCCPLVFRWRRSWAPKISGGIHLPAADHLWSLLRFVELSESQLAHF